VNPLLHLHEKELIPSIHSPRPLQEIPWQSSISVEIVKLKLQF